MSLIIYSILLLIAANLTNVYIDAYKIQHLNKEIKHAINFAAYGLVTLICISLSGYNNLNVLWFCINAFAVRQIFFDIPLNLRRGLSWDYVTAATPPGAIMDRIEIYVFGRNGKTPVLVYAALFIITTIILFASQ